MIRIAVAEDEREFRDTCAGFIRRYCEENGVQAEVTVFEDGMDLLDCQEEKGETWDILFLDVQMKHCDGFYTARKIREKDSQAVIVFITTLAQYAVKGYEWRYAGKHFQGRYARYGEGRAGSQCSGTGADCSDGILHGEEIQKTEVNKEIPLRRRVGRPALRRSGILNRNW